MTLDEIQEMENLKAHVSQLEALLIKERAALTRFLVPRRHKIPDCWLEFLHEEGGVYFDEIGYVLAKPLPLAKEKPE